MFRFPPRLHSSALVLPVLFPETSELGGGKWYECEKAGSRSVVHFSRFKGPPHACIPRADYCLHRQVKSCCQDSCAHAGGQAGTLERCDDSVAQQDMIPTNPHIWVG